MTKKKADSPVEDDALDPDWAAENTYSDGTEPQKTPQPKPGDADYDWAANYGGTSDLYTHKFPNGVVVALRPFGDIFSKTWLYKIRNLKTNIDIELAAIDRGTCDAAKEILESLEDDDDVDPIAELWTAWSKSATSNGDGDEGLTSGN